MEIVIQDKPTTVPEAQSEPATLLKRNRSGGEVFPQGGLMVLGNSLHVRG